MYIPQTISDALLSVEQEQQTIEYDASMIDAWHKTNNKIDNGESSSKSQTLNNNVIPVTSKIDESAVCIEANSQDFHCSQKRKGITFVDQNKIIESNSFSTGAAEDLQEAKPLKRRKVTMIRSLSRSSKSFLSLTSAAGNSAKVSNESNFCLYEKKLLVNSLLFQLHYVSSEEQCVSRSPDLNKNDVAKHIESEVNESPYGWFVELDKNCNSDPRKSTNLEFSAVTAPEKTHLEEEAEWALAADTVDDVLADLF